MCTLLDSPCTFPTISTFLFKRLIQISYNKAYESNFGFIPGLASPSENGEFWYQWFPKDTNVYVAPHQTPADKLLQLRHAIGAFSYINVSSTIYKNVYNSMRIAPICEAIPNVCFIICKRDYVENGLSILNARKKNNGDLDKWWSLKPKEIASLTQRNYAEQIAGQLYYTYQQIATDRKRFGKEKFLKIQYEEFCKDVTGSLNLIKMFLNRNGIKIKERNNVPSFFSIRKANRVRIDERQKISDAIQFYFSVIENLK